MPYSDLSDAWNSYDPRYNRVTDPPSTKSIGDSSFDEGINYLTKRSDAYYDWMRQASNDEIRDVRPIDRPNYDLGYSEYDKLPLPASRQPGLDALFGEYQATKGGVSRDQALADALALRGYGRTTPTVEAQQNSMFGEPILFGGEKGALNTGPGVPVANAKELEKLGGDAQYIFQQTGWYRGPDGQWKWTLSDKDADLKPDTFQSYTTGNSPTKDVMLKGLPRKLPEVFSHPSLYETYPHLKDVTIDRLPRSGEGVLAEYSRSTNTLRVADDHPKEQVLSSILHELQHPIQGIEGFGVGGSPEEFYSYKDIQSAPPDVVAVMKAKAHQDYWRLAGEVEARQAQKQFETQNWSQLPTQMEGFPPAEQQLVRQSGSFTASPGKSYLMGYGSAPLANSLEDARPYSPLPPNYLRRQPFATGVPQLPNRSGFDPLLELQGGVSPLGRNRFERSPLRLRGLYRENFPF